MSNILKCIACEKSYSVDGVQFYCTCGGLLNLQLSDPRKNYTSFKKSLKGSSDNQRTSGVWRFADLLPIDARKSEWVTKNEGNTFLYDNHELASWVGIDNLKIKNEGDNPTGSFKDRGMTVAVTRAAQQGIKVVACASTGNTSSSMASYASLAGLQSLVLVPEGSLSPNKLAQAIAFGALTIELKGDFDDGMRLIQEFAKDKAIYPVNSVNPYRIEGQKTIIWELLEQLDFQSPDWIVFPAGNLGNYSAFGKAVEEFFEYRLITKKPRLAGIQGEGANPFYLGYQSDFKKTFTVKAETVATAIRIGNPANLPRAITSLKATNGIVAEVSDNEIMNAKAKVDRSGIGAEPASCAAIAGLKKLLREGVIKKNESVVAILTGHVLKDTDAILDYHTNKNSRFDTTYANKPVKLAPERKEIENLLNRIT